MGEGGGAGGLGMQCPCGGHGCRAPRGFGGVIPSQRVTHSILHALQYGALGSGPSLPPVRDCSNMDDMLMRQ